MELGWLPGLWMLLALPVVVALYWFKRRSQPRVVAGLFLWGAHRLDDPGRSRTPPPVTRTLVAELLIVLLCALVVADLRRAEPHRDPPVMVVLDTNMALLAQHPGGGEPGTVGSATVADDLRRELSQWISQARVRPWLILSGITPRALSAAPLPMREARERVGEWIPNAPHHDPRPALNLAAELGGPGVPIVWVSDRMPKGGLPDGVHAVLFGPKAPLDGYRADTVAMNTGLVDVGWGYADGEPVNGVISAWARLGRWSMMPAPPTEEDTGSPGATALRLPGPVELTMTVWNAAGQSVRSTRSAVPHEGADTLVEFPVPTGTVEVRFDLPRDLFPLDNTATLFVRPALPLRLAVAHPDTTLQAAIGRFADLVPHRLRVVGASEAPEWLWTVPDNLSSAPLIVQVPTVPVGAEGAFRGPFLARENDPLTDGVPTAGLLWVPGGWGLVGGTPLWRAGAGVLADTATDDAGRRVVRLDIDAARSSWLRHPFFPALMNNLLLEAEQLRPHLPDKPFRLGADAETFADLVGRIVASFGSGGGEGAGEVGPAASILSANRDDAGHERLGRAWPGAFLPQEPGRYVLGVVAGSKASEDRGIAEEGGFQGYFSTALLHAPTSDLSGRVRRIRWPDRPAEGEPGQGSPNPWLAALLLAAGAALVLDWWWIRRQRMAADKWGTPQASADVSTFPLASPRGGGRP